MRNISPASLAIIAQAKGIHPITLVRVYWTDTDIVTYSDKKTPQFPPTEGKILELSNIDSVLNTLTGSNTQSVTVKLSDTDGSIKTIFDLTDVHRRRVQVLQWFEEVPISDSFVIYEGVLSSPIVWSEHERTFQFDIVSKIDDAEVGFSVEDGDFENVPQEIIGKAWPLVFGTVINMPALRFDEIPDGVTATATGIPDESLTRQAGFLTCHSDKTIAVAACLSRAGAKLRFEGSLGGAGLAVFEKGVQLQQRAQDMLRQAAAQSSRESYRLKSIHKKQTERYDPNNVTILNGFKFIQNTPVGIKIGEAHYFGIFHDDQFSVISRRRPDESNAPPTDSTGGGASSGGGSNSVDIEDPENDFLDRALFDLIDPDDFVTATDRDKIEDPCGPHNLIVPDNCGPSGGGGSRNQTHPQREQGLLLLPAGTPVKPDQSYPIRHIINIIPGTVVLGVAAERSFSGGGNTLTRTLVGVPSTYYTVSQQVFGSITATILTLNQPLSSIENEDWGDDLFVTVQSPIGPNIVDIIQYIIQRWAPGFAIDSTSFNHVKTLVANYPANFVLTERKNLITLLKDIAYQARCIVWLSNETFYIRYLPEAQTPIETITESDVISKSLEVTTTRTEDIFTKFTAVWKQDGHQSKPNKVIVRNNLGKYGLHEKEINFFIYNNFDAVEKSLTFIAIRESNVYKILKCKVPATKLKIETLDWVTFDFDRNYIANGPIDGLITKATFDSKEMHIELEAWIPIRLGEMTLYNNAIPAEAEIIITGRDDEQAGSQGENRQAEGDLGYGAGTGITYNIRRTNKAKPNITNDTNDTNLVPPINTTLNGTNKTIKEPPDPRGKTIIMRPNQVLYFDPRTKEMERPKITFDDGGIPAQIADKNGADPDVDGGVEFSILLYEKGIDQEATPANATLLNFDEEDDLPGGLWVTITRKIYTRPSGDDGDTEIITKLFINLTTWVPEDEG